MKKKTVIIIITIVATIAICTVAAMYTPPGFGHSVTMVTSNGGISRHPVLLGLNMNKYVILVTGTIVPPYSGGFRIELEGEPAITPRIYSTFPPPFYLGLNHFHNYSDNKVTNISPWDKFILTVCLEPEHIISKESNYMLKFYDLKSEKQVLAVPITFMELDNFNISKKVRRPYPVHCEHTAGKVAGSNLKGL